jgi:hypothetical protein
MPTLTGWLCRPEFFCAGKHVGAHAAGNAWPEISQDEQGIENITVVVRLAARGFPIRNRLPPRCWRQQPRPTCPSTG